MLATLCAAAAICGACFLIGQAVLKVAGIPTAAGWSGAVGFAAAMVLSSACVRLPGDGTAAAVGLLVASAAAALYVWRDWRRPAPEMLVALVAVVLLTLLPYAANARFGVLGVSFNNDAAWHLVWTEWLASGGETGIEPSAGYPFGPHALTAATGSLLGMANDHALMGMTMAVLVVVLPTFWSLLDPLPPRRRAVAAALVSLCYLVAAYYAQAAFKETVQILLLAGFVAWLRDADLLRPRTLAVPALLTAGFFYNYSYTGIAWPLLVLIVWGTVVTVRRYGVRPAAIAAGVRHAMRGRELRRSAIAALAVAGAAALLLAPELSRISDFIGELGTSPAGTGTILGNDRGNLVGPLPSFEAFGLWPSSDFRFAPDPDFTRYVYGLAGLAAVLWGSVWCLRRRRELLPAAGVACAGIYLLLEARESLYISAKGLVILAPFALLPAALWLFFPDGRWKDLLAAVFTAVALYSSFLVLTGASVGPRAPGDELASIRPLVKGSSVLALVNDDYLDWDLRGARVMGLNDFSPRLEKRHADGRPADINTAPAAVLNAHAWVLTTNTPFASTPPRGVVAVRRTRLFTLWRRERPMAERRTLAEGTAPGAVLDCDTARGRALAARRGFAVVLPLPLRRHLVGAERFAGDDGRRVSLRLPPGRWDLSLQYTSSHTIEIRAPSLSATAPPVLDRAGNVREIGSLERRSGRPFAVELRVNDPSILPTQTRGAIVDAIAATRAGVRPRVVPLRAACGRYVDWYVLGRNRPPVPPGI